MSVCGLSSFMKNKLSDPVSQQILVHSSFIVLFFWRGGVCFHFRKLVCEKLTWMYVIVSLQMTLKSIDLASFLTPFYGFASLAAHRIAVLGSLVITSNSTPLSRLAPFVYSDPFLSDVMFFFPSSETQPASLIFLFLQSPKPMNYFLNISWIA